MDTCWQTETGGFMLIPLPGATPTKPGSATKSFPGILTDVVDLDGNPVSDNAGGYLVVKHPWASMMRTTTAMMSAFAAPIGSTFRLRMASICYFAGDGARRDEDGYWVYGLSGRRAQRFATCSTFRVTASAP
ncbi:MAG: AMP-binding protein [Leptolyngbya sp. SIOISBB]|nr:AMP-binding protein [Leptolyngbya sp. SIOISBB]